jgi:C4-dicarboxylate-specific signal transduction histidine kinase
MDVAWLSVPQRRNGEPKTRTTRGRGKVRWQVTAADLKKLERLGVRARGGTHSFEIRVKQGSGTKRWIPVKTSFEGVARGTRASRLVAKMTDGGREWHLQVARLGRLAVLGRLLEALAHDLAQPLTAIMSNAQAGQRLLSGEQVSAEEMRGILTDIISADTHANALIQKIRALLRRRTRKLEYVDLSDAIRDATDFVSGELAVHRVEVATDIEPDVPAVRADKGELEQVLLNLLLNAMQAMSRTERRRRRVLIRVRRAGAMVELAVEDAGKGLEPSQLTRVFRPFYTTRKDGLGLGLWLCKTIVTAHRGRIWVTRNVGAGITVHFTLRPYQTVATRRLRRPAHPTATIRASREAIARE